MLNPTAADAAERVDRALAGGLRGVCLFPAMHRYSIQDERVKPMPRKSRAHAGRAVVRALRRSDRRGAKKLGLPSPFDHALLQPDRSACRRAAISEVNFVVPAFRRRLFARGVDAGRSCPNVYIDTSSSNSWTKYHPESLNLAEAFRRTLGIVGPTRVLFGTDSSFFPRGWHAKIFERQTEVLQQLGTSEADARQILGRNLTRLCFV